MYSYSRTVGAYWLHSPVLKQRLFNIWFHINIDKLSMWLFVQCTCIWTVYREFYTVFYKVLCRYIGSWVTVCVWFDLWCFVCWFINHVCVYKTLPLSHTHTTLTADNNTLTSISSHLSAKIILMSHCERRIERHLYKKQQVKNTGSTTGSLPISGYRNNL